MIKNEEIRNSLLNSFPAFDGDAKFEIEKNIMPQFVFYKKNGCHVDAYCTQCETLYHQDEKSRVNVIHKHGMQVRCPHCNTQVFMYCAGYGTCEVSEQGRRNVIVFFSRDNDLYIRCFKVNFYFEDYGVRKIPQYSYYECYRYYYGKYGCQKWKKTIDYNFKKTIWKEQKNMSEPIFRTSLYGRADNSYHISGLYNLGKTMFKYSCFDEVDRIFTDSGYNFYVFSYLNEYFRHPNIEYLIKGGFEEVFKSYMKKEYAYRFKINFKSNDLKKMLGLNAKEIKSFKHKKCEEISNYKNLKKYFPNVKLEILTAFNDIYGRYGTELCYIAEKTKLSFECLTNYMKKSNMRCFELNEWKDYINQCISLGYNLEESEINRPKNLHTAHERLTKIIEHRRQKDLDEKIKKRFETLLKVRCMEDDVFIIIPPKSQQEIIDEGKALSHCVGSYADKHANGQCDILFLRKKEEIDKPYYTIEIRGSDIWQYRGYKNNMADNPVPECVENFIKEYKKFLKKAGK